jgi:hypothetical protein
VIQKIGVALSILALGAVLLGMGSQLALAAAPANDNIANATVLTTFPFTDQFNTEGATTEAGEPGDCGTPSHTVWYKFESGTASYVMTVSTAGSDYPASMGLYTGSPGSLEVRICVPPNTTMTFGTSPGETWYVQVSGQFLGGTTTGGGGAGFDFGNLVFNADAKQIVPITVSLSVNPTATVSRAGDTVVVSGTLTCSRTSSATVSVTVTQVFAGRLVATGGGSDQFECGTSPTGWTATVTDSSFVRFGPGNATFDASAYASDDHGDGADSTAGKLKLKRH